jgi:hypothetical protein
MLHMLIAKSSQPEGQTGYVLQTLWTHGTVALIFYVGYSIFAFVIKLTSIIHSSLAFRGFVLRSFAKSHGRPKNKNTPPGPFN